MEIINLQLEIFIIVASGFYFAKKGMVSKETRRQLTDIMIFWILPCTIVKSFSMEMTIDILKDTALILFISFIIQISYNVINRFLYNKFPHNQAIVMKYATIVSNAGFMGMPIVSSVYGTTGLLYCSIALIPLRIFMWTSGLSLFTTTNKKDAMKTVLTHPCIIAVYVGIVFMAILSMGYQIPSFLSTTISAIGGCNTAISMFIIGAILSDVEWGNVFNKVVLYFSAIRLIIIPLMTLLILKLCHVDPLVIGVSVLLTAMPAGSTAAMLAQKYDQDVLFASQLVFVTTLLSLVTLPMISFIINL